jgi:hypothetical protein
MALPSDIFNHILEMASDNYDFLYRCSLVNWEFNHAASRLLYFLVVLSPRFKPVLDLRDTGSIPVSAVMHVAFLGSTFPGFSSLLLSLRIQPMICKISRKHPISRLL